MKEDYIFISAPGINDLVKQFPSEEDLIRFPNISAGHVGKLLEEYFSFSGFYKIKNVSEKYIHLQKLKESVSKDYEILNLEFNHTSFLQSYANSGVSFLRGRFNSKNLEGTIKKIGFSDYQIHITQSE